MNKEIKHNAEKSNPFITPDNYFTTLEDSILQETIGEDSKESSPFTTPEDYFTHLEENILNQTIYKNKQQQGEILSLLSKKWYAIAACLIFAVSIGFYMLTINKSETQAIVQQNKSLKDTVKDKFYTIVNNTKKDTNSYSNTTSEKDSKNNSYVSNDTKPKVSEKKENNKINASISNKEKRSSEVIYGLYFEDDFTDLEEGYLF